VVKEAIGSPPSLKYTSADRDPDQLHQRGVVKEAIGSPPS
jgi:hypothetical protein